MINEKTKKLIQEYNDCKIEAGVLLTDLVKANPGDAQLAESLDNLQDDISSAEFEALFDMMSALGLDMNDAGEWVEQQDLLKGCSGKCEGCKCKELDAEEAFDPTVDEDLESRLDVLLDEDLGGE